MAALIVTRLQSFLLGCFVNNLDDNADLVSG